MFNDHLKSVEFQPGVYFDLSRMTLACKWVFKIVICTLFLTKVFVLLVRNLGKTSI